VEKRDEYVPKREVGATLIKLPKARKFTVTREQLWQISVNAELQGGNKIYAYRTNKIIDEVIEEHDK
jgi:hypothetical protein